jgi:hypothetical protein
VTLYLVASAALGGYLVSAALFVMSGLSPDSDVSFGSVAHCHVQRINAH